MLFTLFLLFSACHKQKTRRTGLAFPLLGSGAASKEKRRQASKSAQKREIRIVIFCDGPYPAR
jgi:hypothetical protein